MRPDNNRKERQMSKKDVINSGIQLARKYGFTVPPALDKEIADLANPQYRVAVVGRYQVGKSTLINRVFLRNNQILTEGNGLATTAAGTETSWGPSRSMKVYDWDNNCIKTIDDPTADDVREWTVGAAGAREALINKVGKVCITEPNDGLKSYTILDTPGVDDPDVSLLIKTTYNIIPSADAAILVTEPRMLDTREIELLQNKLVANGISRLMVMISYNPKQAMTAKRRADIVETIKAMLNNAGVKNVPVYMFSFDPELEDTLNTPEKINTAILQYLDANVQPGREDRVVAHVKKFLGDCVEALKVRIAAAGMSAEKRSAQILELDAQRKEMEDKFAKISSRLNDDFFGIANRHSLDLKTKSSQIFKDARATIDKAADITELKKIIDSLNENLQKSLADLLLAQTADMKEEIRVAVAKRIPEMEIGRPKTPDTNLGDIVFDPGFFAKIPNWIYELINIVGVDFLLPGGFIWGTIFRIIQTKIPFLKDLTLQNLALTLMKNNIISAIDTASQELTDNIDAKFKESFAAISENINNCIRELLDERIAMIKENINDAPDAVDTASLENGVTEINRFISAN